MKRLLHRQDWWKRRHDYRFNGRDWSCFDKVLERIAWVGLVVVVVVAVLKVALWMTNLWL